MSEYPFAVIESKLSYPVVVVDFKGEVWNDCKTPGLIGWQESLIQPTIVLAKNLPEVDDYNLAEKIYDADYIIVLAVECEEGFKVVASYLDQIPGLEKGQIIGPDSLVKFEG